MTEKNRANSAMRAAIAELDELALDAAVSPSAILVGEPKDQVLEIGVEGSSLAGRTTLVDGPLAADEFAIPSKEGLGSWE